MDIEQEITKIKERNNSVESDKAWEVSVTRKLTICILTYLIILLYNCLLANKMNIFLTSAIPIIGYYFSTLSLPVVRKFWGKNK